MCQGLVSHLTIFKMSQLLLALGLRELRDFL